jgi:hypothetical protein
MSPGGTDSLWKLDACVKAGVLVGLVCLMTTLKECVVSGQSKQGIGHAKNVGVEGIA